MLNQYDIKATFFVVGSRVISRPQMLQVPFASLASWARPK